MKPGSRSSRAGSSRRPGRHPGAPALPVWVKRGDVHNTQEGDVVFAETEGAVEDALGRFHARGIPRAVLQPHVAGDLIKFYGVGPGGGPDGGPPWFRWFYHKDQTLAGHPLDPRQLAHLARRAAARARARDLRRRRHRHRRMAAWSSSTSTRGRASPSTATRPRRPSPPTWPCASTGGARTERREVGPRSQEIVAREQRHLAPGSRASRSTRGWPWRAARARRSSTRTATSTSTSSRASRSAASGTAIPTTSTRSSARSSTSPSAASPPRRARASSTCSPP